MRQLNARSPVSALLRLRNAVDYPLRQFFRWRRAGFALSRRPLDGLFAHLQPEERLRAEKEAARLQAQYHFEGFARDSAPVNFRENLFYLAMLETALERSGAPLPDPANAADIGPSHWFYVQALHALLRWWNCPAGRGVSLTGFEVDAYRVYTDLHSRFDHAQAHMRGLRGVEYAPRGFAVQPGGFDLITMLFPFVFERDHLEWGLPSHLFRPAQLLAAAWESLKPGGALVIVNQGIDEHEAQRAALLAQGIPVSAAFRQDPLLFSYDLERWVLVSRRER